MSLTDLHRTLHDRLLSLLEDTFVSALALDFSFALAQLDRLTESLINHQHHEESALATIARCEPPPRGGSTELVIAEHRKLDALLLDVRRVLASLHELPASLTPEQLRRALVRHLDPLMRLRHLLEHHTERENTLVYPHLANHLAPDIHHTLSTHLRTLLTTLQAP